MTGHRKRLKARLLENPSGLAEYEVLELLLGNILLRRDTKELSKELLERFGSIRGVIDARISELTQVPGFGPALAGYWVLLREVMARYVEAPARRKEQLTSPLLVAKMARRRLRGLEVEEIWAAFMDTQNNLLAWERISRGTLETASFYPRDVVARALVLKAKAMIIVHNHPGGSPYPSGADLTLTRALKEAAKTLDLLVQDHVIVTDEHCYSLSQEGLLPE